MCETPIYDTPPVWMTNDIGGKVEVYERYIYIKFSHSRRKEYRINAEYLYKHLRNNVCEFPHGGLVFIPLFYPNVEAELSIVNETTSSDKDTAVVNRKEFMEALYCCFA
jgi:hypothetical protein